MEPSSDSLTPYRTLLLGNSCARESNMVKEIRYQLMEKLALIDRCYPSGVQKIAPKKLPPIEDSGQPFQPYIGAHDKRLARPSPNIQKICQRLMKQPSTYQKAKKNPRTPLVSPPHDCCL